MIVAVFTVFGDAAIQVAGQCAGALGTLQIASPPARHAPETSRSRWRGWQRSLPLRSRTACSTPARTSSPPSSPRPGHPRSTGRRRSRRGPCRRAGRPGRSTFGPQQSTDARAHRIAHMVAPHRVDAADHAAFDEQDGKIPPSACRSATRARNASMKGTAATVSLPGAGVDTDPASLTGTTLWGRFRRSRTPGSAGYGRVRRA
jgi:hypothetical protein